VIAPSGAPAPGPARELPGAAPGPAGAPWATLRASLLDPRSHGALLVACASIILFARAGAGPLPNYDDAYYAEKAKQMLHTGDWLTPRFAGAERLDNPPLFLWLIAASFAVMGVNAFAAVFWSALAGVACVWLTHRLALRLGREPFEAWAAGLVLLGTGYVLKYANHAMFDVFLMALFLAALLAYRAAWEGSARAWAALGLCAGLGVLTKSALGLFPLVVAGVHALATGRTLRSLRDGAWLSPLVAAAVVAPWYGYQLATHREAFLAEHVAWLLVERGTGAGVGAPPLDPLGYLRELAVTYWPWLPAALAGLALTAREAAGLRRPAAWGPRVSAVLLLVWLAVVLGVMSFGREKKLWYVMSAFPALALLSARALAVWLRSPVLRARVVVLGFALVAAVGATLAFTPWGSAPVRRGDLQQVALASRSLVPAGEPVAFLGGEYFSVAHQYVFYSDRTLLRGDGDPAAVRRALDAGGWALVSREAWPEVAGPDTARFARVVSSGGWTLVHRAPAPEVTLEPVR